MGPMCFCDQTSVLKQRAADKQQATLAPERSPEDMSGSFRDPKDSVPPRLPFVLLSLFTYVSLGPRPVLGTQ